MNSKDKIAVLAGSSAIAFEAGSFVCSLQLRAFEKALGYAEEFRSQLGRVFLQLDHTGDFGEQFLRRDISGEKKRHPRMDYLLPEILCNFQPLLDRSGFASDQIHLIPEQQCRMALSQLYVSRGESRIGHDCESIVAEIFRRMARYGSRVVAFWEENAKRVNPLTIGLGKVRAKEMFGISQEIENIFLSGDTQIIDVAMCQRDCV